MQELINAAYQAQNNAHAPYSEFYVGAALQTDDGTIITGCNIESSSYGLTICAERVAITKAYSQGYRSFTAIAIVTHNGSPPCGACRQYIAELCGNIDMYICSDTKCVAINKAYDMLPNMFNAQNLIKEQAK